ncbi:ComEC/Rec2 family competence protein [Effusibacillus consociatus]|uniref:ComEC/Rec2 family competence protein n=1 Tax=Effusibacillus consociatus TaxID=1117041 RepID=A0ABV9Q593_9BACL
MAFKQNFILWIFVPFLIVAGATMETLLPVTHYFDRLPINTKVDLKGKAAIRFLDLGNGVSAVLQTEEGHHILIDGGEDQSALMILKELAMLEAQRLDFVFLTTPKPEHMGGFGILTQTVPIGKIAYPHLSAAEFGLDAYEAAKSIPRIRLKADQTYILGENLSIKVFNPREPVYGVVGEQSLVFQMTYRGTTILFTGDISEQVTEKLLDLPIESDILVIPNHAKKNSFHTDFLQKVNPKVAVITGVKKGSSSPDESIVEQLYESWIDVYRTDQQGTITVLFSNRSFEVIRP